MLMKSLTSILAVTSMLAVVILLTPAGSVAAESPLTPQAAKEPAWTAADLSGFLADLWQELLGTISAAACNAEDPCAPDACNPEFCTTCNPDPCATDACDPNACDPNGNGGGNGGRFDPGG